MITTFRVLGVTYELVQNDELEDHLLCSRFGVVVRPEGTLNWDECLATTLNFPFSIEPKERRDFERQKRIDRIRFEARVRKGKKSQNLALWPRSKLRITTL